jgi:orotidine-5'-phosphate decarboxylase
MQSKWPRLIVALDIEDRNKIDKAVKSLRLKVKKFKVGLIPFSKFGPDIIREIKKRKADVFLDLKLYDIPNTMKKAARIAAEFGVWAFTIHAKSGQSALSQLKSDLASFCRKKRLKRPLIIGVTELTSTSSSKKKILKLVKACVKAGLDGVVCSAKEAKFIRTRYKKLKIITPGIRPLGFRGDDQRRVTTAKQAFAEGADYIVVGRPIVEQKDYLEAARKVLSC